ncbi:hypothetical protein RFI_06744, partial [Reticulomyxa filosa]
MGAKQTTPVVHQFEPITTLAKPITNLANAGLPYSLTNSQCIFYKDEILICGGYRIRECYSYHIQKQQYKFICSYPPAVVLEGHCVLKLKGNNGQGITLLSFGGQDENEIKYTFVMKYRSVWDEEKSESEFVDENQWVPWVHNNKVVQLGRLKDNFRGVRGVIGGKKSDMLFITYFPDKIDVFNLRTFKYIINVKNSTLPTQPHRYGIHFHCF